MVHFVYILANRPRGAIHIGATASLTTRMDQHMRSRAGSHADRYNIKTLVYFEEHATTRDAIHREKRLKRWRRAWKTELIETANPGWRDLSQDIPLA
ncbi:MAG: GIY-YIG nuclease family protein [Pseudomonadota bacterium]